MRAWPHPNDVAPVTRARVSAVMNGHVSVMMRLLVAGADPLARDCGGNSLLHEAAAAGCVGAVAPLVGAGGELSAGNVNSVGRNPLHVAAIAGHATFVRLCLEVRPL